MAALLLMLLLLLLIYLSIYLPYLALKTTLRQKKQTA
jgi:hypothetical protein